MDRSSVVIPRFFSTCLYKVLSQIQFGQSCNIFVSFVHEKGLWESSSLFGFVSALAPPARMKFKSTLVGSVIHFFCLYLDKTAYLYLCSNTLSYLPRSLSSLLGLDDITPWHWLRPILSCSCFVFSSASGLSQMEAAVDCMPQKAGN